MIDPGIKAPNFTLPNSNGELISLSNFIGSNVLLLFYPRDNSPVCTAQLCDYRDNYSEFIKRGIKVIAISPDKTSSHIKFVSKYDLPFILLSDTSKTVFTEYKAMSFFRLGKRGYVLIDKTGIILFAFSEMSTILRQSNNELLQKIDTFLNTNK